jgi:DNA-binding PadR family transcriptional regulator
MKPLERLQKFNTIGNLWVYILSLLKKEKTHAWRLQSLIKERFGFKPGRITSYRVLYRLEKEGFVKSQTKNRKRIYQITKKGEKELKKAKKLYKNLLASLETL